MKRILQVKKTEAPKGLSGLPEAKQLLVGKAGLEAGSLAIESHGPC